jgi:amidase
VTVLHQSAVSLAAMIRRREISSVELVTEAIARRDRFDPELNAIIWHDDEASLAQARAADAAVARGDEVPAFHGVPVPIKELSWVAGQPGTFGSLGVSDAPRETSDIVVDQLTRAGFVLFGRSNSPEAGPMSVTENQRFGVTRNPWNPRYSPAGSSGGAAVAVAAGYTPVAHATDGGGSIRMPSSATGLVGLKPSRGRVPSLIPGWEHSITDGAITRHVVDTAAMLDELSRFDPRAPYVARPPARPFLAEVGAPTGRRRVGVLLETPSGLPVDPECIAAVTALATEFERQGHVVEPVSPWLFSFEAIMGFLDVIVNAWLWVTPYENPELAEPYIKARRARAADFGAADYAIAAARLYAETAQVTAQWGRDFDVLLTPTMATQPPLVGTVLAEANDDFAGPRVRENQMVAFTAFCNIAGLPAISLPVHTSELGLPIGAQLIGGPFGEAELIRLASSVEETFGWTTRIPDGYR